MKRPITYAALRAFGRVHELRMGDEQLLAVARTDLTVAIQESGATLTNGALPRIQVAPGFEQVFVNLISNAIKYHHRGVAPEIRIDARADGDEWIFSVRDNGIGIGPVIRITSSSVPAAAWTRDPRQRIGLATVRKIVEANGGSIWLESEPGKGSTFFFRLPRPSHNPLAKTAQES